MYTIFYKRFIDYYVIFEICLMASRLRHYVQLQDARRAMCRLIRVGCSRFGGLEFFMPHWLAAPQKPRVTTPPP